MIDKIKIKYYMPKILTAVSIGGVFVTAALSARAAFKYEEATQEPCDKKKEALKAAVPPLVSASVTVGAMALSKQIDAKTIAGLSAAYAALSAKEYNEIHTIKDSLEPEEYKKIAPKIDIPQNASVAIVDDDGKIFVEPTSGLLIKIEESHVMEAFYKLNRNFQLRGGLASLYELLRMMGVKRRDIKRFGLEWTEFIGWGDICCNDGFAWIDFFTDEYRPDGYFEICYPCPPVAICNDPPVNVLDICHFDREDVKDVTLSRDDLKMIKDEIRDGEVA